MLLQQLLYIITIKLLFKIAQFNDILSRVRFTETGALRSKMFRMFQIEFSEARPTSRVRVCDSRDFHSVCNGELLGIRP